MDNVKRHIQNRTKVYSLELGVGEIISLFNLYDGVYDYFEVHFKKGDVKKLFSTSNHDSIRLASSIKVLSHALICLGEKFNDKDFEFEFERNPFNKNETHFDIAFVINIIASSMNQIKLNDYGHEMFSMCLNSLALEVADVFNVSLDGAKDIISDHLRSVA